MTAYVNELRNFAYVILNDEGVPVAHLHIMESKSAASRGALADQVPEYGFQILDGDGNTIAQIASSYWPFIKKIIDVTAPFHSPACEEDCNVSIGALTPTKVESLGQ